MSSQIFFSVLWDIVVENRGVELKQVAGAAICVAGFAMVSGT
jgi:drug/metabolite transporter superfamily protein YnfA